MTLKAFRASETCAIKFEIVFAVARVWNELWPNALSCFQNNCKRAENYQTYTVTLCIFVSMCVCECLYLSFGKQFALHLPQRFLAHNLFNKFYA